MRKLFKNNRKESKIMAKKQNKPIRLKSKINFNIAYVILGIICAYLFVNCVLYFTTERTAYYEVTEGSNAEDIKTSYVGIALRDESIQVSDSSGYIDYYVSECSRVSKSTTLYSIDSKGTLNELLSEATSNDTKLSDDNIQAISDLVNDFSNDYDNMNFEDVYSFKTSLKGTVVDLVNMNKLQQLAKEKGESFSINKSGASGIILYRIDNYETLKPKQLKESDFDRNNCVSAQFSSGTKVKKGSPIYKTIQNEEWCIAVQFTKAQAKKYKGQTGVTIKFLKDDVTTTANLKIVKGADGKKYGLISLSKYLIRYATDRFLDIQIIDNESVGLKIPKTSLVTKDLYVIPKEFGEKGGDSDSIGFNRQIEKNGKITSEFYYPTIADSDDNNYYVSTSLFEPGDVLLSLNSDTQFVIGKTQAFVGVYCINNGYTVFVRINKLETLDEYYIVESGTPYGLRQYDRIVLDGSKVEENQIVFQ